MKTYNRCLDGVEVTLCSIVGNDFAGTQLEEFAGHILYFNEDGFDLAQEGWSFLSKFERDPAPQLVPEPARLLLQMAALAALGLQAFHRRCRPKIAPALRRRREREEAIQVEADMPDLGPLDFSTGSRPDRSPTARCRGRGS